MTTVLLTIEVSDCVYLLECSIYILKYVVAAVVVCGVWEKVDSPVPYMHLTKEWCHCWYCTVAVIPHNQDLWQCSVFYNIYRALWNTFRIHASSCCWCSVYEELKKQVTPPTLKTLTPITFKAVSENVKLYSFWVLKSELFSNRTLPAATVTTIVCANFQKFIQSVMSSKTVPAACCCLLVLLPAVACRCCCLLLSVAVD